MTIATLTYEIKKGQTSTLKVRPFQRLLIGSSNSADIKLINRDGVAPEQCEVKLDGDSFEIANLAKGNLLVNGNPVESSRLNDGDCVEIGNNKLYVALESPSRTTTSLASPAAPPSAVSQSKSEAKSSDATPTDSSDDPEPVFVDCGNGVRTLEMAEFSSNLHGLFAETKGNWQYGVLLNHLASQLKLPPPKSNNLLGQVSEEINSKNDLYFETSEDAKSILDRFCVYAPQNAATLLIFHESKKDVDYPKELKLLAPWFMSSDTLKFNLINGTALLISKIFAHVEAIVIPNPAAKSELVLFNDTSVNDWESFKKKVAGGQV